MGRDTFQLSKVSALYALPIEDTVPTDTIPTYVYIYIYTYACRGTPVPTAYYTSTSMYAYIHTHRYLN